MVGNAEFVKWFQNGVTDCTRLEMQDDIVPRLPMDKSFIHIPNGVQLLKSGVIENDDTTTSLSMRDLVETTLFQHDWRDILVNHSCELYISSLQNLSS